MQILDFGRVEREIDEKERDISNRQLSFHDQYGISVRQASYSHFIEYLHERHRIPQVDCDHNEQHNCFEYAKTSLPLTNPLNEYLDNQKNVKGN